MNRVKEREKTSLERKQQLVVDAFLRTLEKFFGLITADFINQKEFDKRLFSLTCHDCVFIGQSCEGKGLIGIRDIMSECLRYKSLDMLIVNKSRKRREWERIAYDVAVEQWPWIKEEAEDDRDFVSSRLDKKGSGYCLHCNKRIHLSKMPLMVQVYKKTGKAVELDDIGYDPLLLTACQTLDCSGGAFDWFIKPWWRG